MMPNRLILSLFALSCLAIFTMVSAVPVEAASNKRPKPKPERCIPLAKKIGPSRVWWGRHIGWRELHPMFEWGPKRERFNDIGCFRNRKACENWLYWMRTDYPNSTYYKPCRRGL